MKMKIQLVKIYECSRSNAQRKLYNLEYVYLKKCKINNLSFYVRKLGKEQFKLPANKRKEIINIRTGMKEIEGKKIIKSANPTPFF